MFCFAGCFMPVGAGEAWPGAPGWRCWAGWGLGLGLAAVEVVPLAGYLARSPVWEDRREGREGFWSLEAPRVLDSLCTAFPYLYGSQRRGHPNLAKPLGVHNLNESAGGFAGLATLLWLAPVGAAGWRERRVAGFLAALAVLGALAAFSVPPVPNLMGLVPVLDVMDHRRLTLWVSFGLVGLGGLGIDRIGRVSLGWRWVMWERCWRVAAAGMLAGAVAVPLVLPVIRPKVEAHYDRAGASVPGAELAERQLRNLEAFTPFYLGLGALHLLALATISAAVRGGRLAPERAKGLVLAIVLVDLFAFGRGLNPAIEPADERPEGAVIARLKAVAPMPARILPIGEVLPPNRLMSYGLCDVRNYDSVELTRSLDAFSTLYEAEPGSQRVCGKEVLGTSGGARSVRKEDRHLEDSEPVPISASAQASRTPSQARHSRRTISWKGVIRSMDALRAAGVRVVVGATEPPAGTFERVERVGKVWLAFLAPSTSRVVPVENGKIALAVQADEPRPVRLAVTNDRGWRVEIDGRPAACLNRESPFVELDVPEGAHHVSLRYEPAEVRWALGTSCASVVAWALVFAVSRIGLSAGKNRRRAWTHRRGRVRIEFMTSSWSSRPDFPEGRDADGPLHV